MAGSAEKWWTTPQIVAITIIPESVAVAMIRFRDEGSAASATGTSSASGGRVSEGEAALGLGSSAGGATDGGRVRRGAEDLGPPVVPSEGRGAGGVDSGGTSASWAGASCGEVWVGGSSIGTSAFAFGNEPVEALGTKSASGEVWVGGSSIGTRSARVSSEARRGEISVGDSSADSGVAGASGVSDAAGCVKGPVAFSDAPGAEARACGNEPLIGHGTESSSEAATAGAEGLVGRVESSFVRSLPNEPVPALGAEGTALGNEPVLGGPATGSTGPAFGIDSIVGCEGSESKTGAGVVAGGGADGTSF